PPRLSLPGPERPAARPGHSAADEVVGRARLHEERAARRPDRGHVVRRGGHPRARRLDGAGGQGEKEMRGRFWGTRGSVAQPGPATVRYGGNTSCVEVRADDGTLIVLDCGTGAHALGQALMAGPRPVRGHLLITHTHWDHIQGFPFFAPLFVPGNEWDVYAP